jgi:hypothetical protein
MSIILYASKEEAKKEQRAKCIPALCKAIAYLIVLIIAICDFGIVDGEANTTERSYY